MTVLYCYCRAPSRAAFAALCGIVVLSMSAGCQPAQRRVGPVRAIWVTRFDYETADDVVRIVEDCRRAGFNTVLFQVRGNGTAFYRSSFEPWAEQFGFADPGFDPLETAVREAHRGGMELHAWVNVMPAWRGETPPADPEQLYHKHPEWFWYDQYGDRQALSSFYVSLNPCLPEVREYLVSVFREIVRDYDIDGLHMDYIRFPNEPPARPADSDIDYPRDARTLALYRRETGLTPADDGEAWNRWRTEQVTRLVADVHAMMRETDPEAILSAAVGTNRERSLNCFRDGERWAADGLVDAVFPMNYRDDLETFQTGLGQWLPYTEEVTVVPGLWFSPRVGPDEGISVVRQQIEAALDATGNFCVFAYSLLFDSRDDQVTRQNEKQNNTRALRRCELIPFLQSLADRDTARSP